MRSYRNSAGDEAVRQMSRATKCVWPDCETAVWQELSIALCPYHAAHVYMKVEEIRPRRDPKRETPERDLINGTIYYAETEGGQIKIGFSTNVRGRMSYLRTKLLASHPGTRRDERAAHMEFGEYWTKGEYFTPGPRLMARIDELRRAAA